MLLAWGHRAAEGSSGGERGSQTREGQRVVMPGGGGFPAPASPQRLGCGGGSELRQEAGPSHRGWELPTSAGNPVLLRLFLLT